MSDAAAEGTGLTPALLLHAYASGVFPMSEGRTDPEIFWVDPRRRGIFPLDRFHISRSLARRMRRGPFRVTMDQDFDAVLAACADRPETWINAPIARLYGELHRLGRAHSVEVWEGEALVGGTYGVTLGSAWFGESMFSRRTDASKVALACLVDLLRRAGFTLFDTQFLTPHLATLGAVEIPRAAYRRRLAEAQSRPADLLAAGPIAQPPEVVQRSAQTS